MRAVAWAIIIIIISGFGWCCCPVEAAEPGLVDALKTLANRLAMGRDMAKGIAQLVVESFAKHKTPGDSEGMNLFSGFFRLMGLENAKLGAIAVNGIIFIAQLISTSLSNPKINTKKSARPGSPLDWLLNSPNPELQDLIRRAKSEDLSNNIINYIKDNSDGDMDCMQMLVCKLMPIIKGMQTRVVKGLPSVGPAKEDGAMDATEMFSDLPNFDFVADNADICEEKYAGCILGD